MITEQHAPVLVLLCCSHLYFPKAYSAKFVVKETTSPFSRIFFHSLSQFFLIQLHDTQLFRHIFLHDLERKAIS